MADRAAFTTDPVTNLRTGLSFLAEIDGSPDAVLVATELGEDYRNMILLHVNDDVSAAGIRSQDRVSFTLFKRAITAQILKRRDNGANAQAEFWAMQITGKDS